MSAMRGQEPAVYVAGHDGMVGSAIVRRLKQAGCSNLICRSRSELDLADQREVRRFFSDHRIGQVFVAAARVGGIQANNSRPAEFIYENLAIQNNLIHSAYEAGVERLLFLGSSCIYPVESPQPITEGALLNGPLEPTNEPYAIAKIAGIKLCESYNRQYGHDYRCLMPTNLYGPNDNFDLISSHVIPGFIRRFHEAVCSGARNVSVWGSGTPQREFLHVDDLAAACVHVMALDPETYWNVVQERCSHLNVGSGHEMSIRVLAEKIAGITGFQGDILWDESRPDGAPRKCLDSSKIRNLGWDPEISLDSGLQCVYEWFLKHGQA